MNVVIMKASRSSTTESRSGRTTASTAHADDVRIGHDRSQRNRLRHLLLQGVPVDETSVHLLGQVAVHATLASAHHAVGLSDAATEPTPCESTHVLTLQVHAVRAHM